MVDRRRADAPVHSAVRESTDEWERHAEWWQSNFTDGADPEYSELIIPMLLDHLRGLSPPPAGGAGARRGERTGPIVLDAGTGEGQVGRAIAEALDWGVVGCDTAWGQLSEARRRGQAPYCVLSGVTALALADSSIDAAVACLLLEHVADLDGALGELARVLRPGGRLIMVLNHPIVATPGSGWIDDHMLDPPEQYWQLGPYLPEVAVRETVARGVRITFHHRPLSRYLNSARELGLVLIHMDEPAPPADFVALSPEYESQATMPRMMVLVLERT